MAQQRETKVTSIRIRQGSLLSETPENEEGRVEWREIPKRHRGEDFVKNLSVAAGLVLCAVALRTGALPSLSKTSDAVMTAATDQSLLDEQLGKLSFVSALFPEAVLVFGESSSEQLSVPVSGGTVVHAWSEAEPYLSWRTDSRSVFASCDGEVVGVYHGNGDERLVQIAGQDGLSCVYGNLDQVMVRTGDAICAGDQIGTLLVGEDFVFEVRRDGRSIDPARYLAQ